ncbi:hypothetical protein ACI3PL_23080, partial [Lacticaseibacillus paracasei]
MTDELRDKLYTSCVCGFTTIFEWTAPENRIVIGYDKTELTLLAVRNINSGQYFDLHQKNIAAYELGLKTVKTYKGSEATFDEIE